MKGVPESLNNLIAEFSNLPGVGKKTAERLAIYVLKSDKDKVLPLSDAIISVKSQIEFHDLCFSFVENGECVICDDSSRNNKLLCILKDPTDIFIIEKTGYNGLYHILGNLISPIDGVSEDDLNIGTLLNRLDSISEIILATDASLEGDATALYLSDLLKDYSVKVSRLARGLPIGGTLEHVDQTTLSRSIEDRVELK